MKPTKASFVAFHYSRARGVQPCVKGCGRDAVATVRMDPTSTVLICEECIAEAVAFSVTRTNDGELVK